MRVEVLGGVERRRRWARDDKMRIIEETLAPGAVVTEIARRRGIATSSVFTWRRRARLATVASTGPRLVPVRVAAAAAESVRSIEAPAAMPARKRRGLIEIELGDDNRDLLAEMRANRDELRALAEVKRNAGNTVRAVAQTCEELGGALKEGNRTAEDNNKLLKRAS
jgi:transposase